MAFVTDDVAPSEASGVSAIAAARPDETEERREECPAVAPDANASDPQDPEVAWMDELELALRKAIQARCFEALDDTRNTLLATTQLTISNVMSTVVTALHHRGTHRKRSKQPSTPLAIEGNQESRETIYGAPKPSAKALARFKKGRRGSQQHQAQLPAFRRSLPALAIPVSRLHHELLRERDAFMAQLSREREEKAQLEDWAATRIQACYRGFRSRPRIVAYARRLKRQAMRSLSAIRLDVRGSLSLSPCCCLSSWLKWRICVGLA
ncbi:hypothetical protein BBJ28_00002348 [Nothophytophthora sp. Chile5]|nr:hypothetical protein BBJ28_00002348 [Nothophytophthora sp. Chile5]